MATAPYAHSSPTTYPGTGLFAWYDRHMDTAASGGERTVSIPVELEDPFALPLGLSELRTAEPLHRLSYLDGQVGWLVTDYATGRSVLMDSRFDTTETPAIPLGDLARTTALRESREKDGILEPLIHHNPPRHTRLRRTMMPSYTNARVLDYREEIREAVAGCLDTMERSGPPVELVSAFAEPVVTAAHAEVFGISRADCARLVEETAKLQDVSVPAEEAIAAGRATATWIHDLLEEKRAHPADDVMSALATSDLSPDEAVSQAVDLASSGHDTVIGMIANSVFVLLCHPDELRALQHDPSLMEGAVDELVRYFTLLKASFTRIAREDVEVAGRLISAGECVTVSIAAANRDPQRFEEPERFDVSRNARGHLGFGHGVHVCMGQHLARMEMRVALAALIQRFPTLRLASSPDEVELSAPGHILHYVKRMQVAW